MFIKINTGSNEIQRIFIRNITAIKTEKLSDDNYKVVITTVSGYTVYANMDDSEHTDLLYQIGNKKPLSTETNHGNHTIRP